MSDDAKQANTQPKTKNRVRFFIDPEKSDQEIYDALMEMARKRGFDVPGSPSEK